MNRPFDSDLDTEVRYLLGKMDDAEREAFQERVLDDPAVFDRVSDAENQLFDAYARGALDPLDRRRVQQRLLRSPRQEQKLRTARALSARMQRKRFGVPAAFAVAAAIALAVAVPALLRQRSAPVTDSRAAASPPARFTISLPLQTTRAAASVPGYTIPAEASGVEIRIPVPPDEPAASLRAELLLKDQTVEVLGDSPRVVEDAAGQQFVTLAAGSLAPGAYRVRLTGQGGSSVAWFDFRVEEPAQGP
jgi:hypothetical protein